MALKRVDYIQQMEVLPDGQVQVRRAFHIEDHDVPITEPQGHRSVLEPGSTGVADLPDWWRGIVEAAWTDAVVAAYRAAAEERERKRRDRK